MSIFFEDVRFVQGEILVSTVGVYDSEEPYETGVRHPQYRDGDAIVVESYADEHLARRGHQHWIEIMTSDDLPDEIADCGLSFIKRLAYGGDNPVYKRESNS